MESELKLKLMSNKNFVHDAELENAVFDSHSFIFFILVMSVVLSVGTVLLFLSCGMSLGIHLVFT